MIIACVAAAVLMTFAYIFMTAPVYKATAVLLVDPRTPNVTEANEVLGGYGGDSAAIASQVEVLGSSNLLWRVIRSEGILTDPEFAKPGLIGGLLGSQRSENQIFEAFRKRLEVVRQGTTYVIDVAFSSTDREKAARIANAVINAYLTGQRTQKTQLNNDVNQQLEGRIKVLRESVSKAEAAVANYMATNAIVETGTGGTLLQAQIEQVNTQSIAALSAASAAQNALRVAEQNASSNLDLAVNAIDTPSAVRLRADLDTLEAQRSRQSAVLGAMHPQMQSLGTEINRVRTSLRAEVQRDLVQKRTEAARAKQDADNLIRELNRSRSQLDTANQQRVELNQLQRQAAAARGVLEQFERRAEELGQMDALQQTYASVISPSTPPTGASWPKPALLLPVMGAFGGFIGVALALLLNVTNFSLAGNTPASMARKEEAAAPEAKPSSLLNAPQAKRAAVLELGTINLHGKAQDGAKNLELLRLLLRLTSRLEPQDTPYVITVDALHNGLPAFEVTRAFAEELSAAGTKVAVINFDGKKSREVPSDIKTWLPAEIARNRGEIAQTFLHRDPVWVSMQNNAAPDAIRDDFELVRANIAPAPDFFILRSSAGELREALGEFINFEIVVLDKEDEVPASARPAGPQAQQGVVRVVLG